MAQSLYCILLQTTSYLSLPDTTSIIIFVIIIVILVLLIILGSILSKKPVLRGSTSGKRYNKFVFERMARDVGFEKRHIDTLKRLIVISNIRHPLFLFTNAGLLDSVLKKGIYSIERQPSLSEDERIQLLNTIYEIKQTIEFHAKRGLGLRSTYLIKPGQLFTLHHETGERFHSKLISNHSSALVCSYPVVPPGNQYMFRKGTHLKVFFWRERDTGYSFPSHVLGFDRTGTVPNISLQHSRKIKREQHRKFNRKPLKKSCFIYPLKIVYEGTKRNPRKKVIPEENKRQIAVIFDISVGGCRIGCPSIHSKGSYLKLEFDIKPRTPVTALGKVLSIKQRPGSGANHIVHVKFVKLTSKSRNFIYSYVYNYI
ncbi:MAG: PilZ domain-containing protein [Spirochaetales bacterium]|nr:PilZ domain-containing protein [Spirochaetales bacterium]